MALYQSLDPVNSTITHPPSSDHYGGASDFPHCLLTISYPLHVYGEASDVPLCQMQIDGRRSATYPETQSCGASLIDSAFYEGGPQQQKSQRHNAPQSPIQPVQKYHRHFLRNPPTHSPSDLEAPLTDQHKLESCRSTVVSTEETPSPRPRPKKQGEKLTEEDVELLLSLKKEKKLPWSKIAEYFPGRSSGTLQVYYCKKLKNRGKLWTADTDKRLQEALALYEQGKWHVIARVVGAGFTPGSCESRARDISTSTCPVSSNSLQA